MISSTAALLACKCPQCRTGQVFKHIAYHPKFMQMHKECPRCGLDYEPEPGFYYSAMYISYGINVAIVLTLGFGIAMITGTRNIWAYVLPIWAAILLSVPLTLRYSRMLTLYLVSGAKFNPSLFGAKVVKLPTDK